MSSFLGFCEWNTRNRWRDGQVCPDVDKELWRLGPDGSGVFWRWTSVSRWGQGTMAPWARRLGRRGDPKKKKRGGDPKGEVEKRARKRRGLVVLGSGEENPRVLFRDADQESKTRMRNNALRTGPRQAVDPVVKVSDHGRHVMSSSPVPLKTYRVGQRCTSNLSTAQMSSCWCGAVVRREVASSGVIHVT
ncbi:hypothetical protein TNCV_2540921 [Trichonephila clavipes]|nr:hypothetical protein TNCV_2540921 [Trichonephila clavipes]